jgi:tetratricopeptide (TPR) repeat protein
MDCPRCGHTGIADPICPRCGVVFAKLGSDPDRRHRRPPEGEHGERRVRPRERPAAPSSSPWTWILLAGAVAAGAGGVLAVRRPAPRPAVLPSSTPPETAADVPPPPTLPSQEAQITPPPLALTAPDIDAADRELARNLAARLAFADEAAVQSAEGLLARHPDAPDLRRLLSAVLQSAAQRAQRQQRRDLAVAWLQRATQLDEDVQPWLVLAQLLGENGDWNGAEAAARGAIRLHPRNPSAWSALGYALMRLDRNAEAAEALQASLGLFDHPSTRALLAKVQKSLQDERGMTQQTLSHFNVRYDGEAHESVGHEILRTLERHYATLASALGHQPASSISVILFTNQAYYDASGAPAWSGGAFDTLDGRIRVPIGGLTASLTPDMEGVLLHELTHAFVADRTRGVAPRDVHEGLAQYMEGKRCDALLGNDGLRALADGRVPGVQGYYLGALSFIEYLVLNHGLSGINELLKGMADTGSPDQAFRQVYGQGHAETRALWIARLKQQYGS